MSINYYKSGDANGICDSCGFKFKLSQLRQRWEGYWVCEADWEPRHIQDFLKAPKGERQLPVTRPEPQDTTISVTYISSSVGHQDLTVPSGTFDQSL